jgi:ABC-type multidrug transport system fused ATPase/permease subunit
MSVESEVDDGTRQVAADWPTQGTVEFNHVTLLYLPWLPPALNGVSFSIQPREQVIVNSTKPFMVFSDTYTIFWRVKLET